MPRSSPVATPVTRADGGGRQQRQPAPLPSRPQPLPLLLPGRRRRRRRNLGSRLDRGAEDVVAAGVGLLRLVLLVVHLRPVVVVVVATDGRGVRPLPRLAVAARPRQERRDGRRPAVLDERVRARGGRRRRQRLDLVRGQGGEDLRLLVRRRAAVLLQVLEDVVFDQADDVLERRT